MFKDFIAPLAALIIGVFVAAVLLLAVLQAVSNRINFGPTVAKIEQVRQDVASLDGQSISEDVIGQVTQWNQTIRSMQAYNRMPVICLTIPNGWDDVEVIAMPKGGDQ